MIKMIKNDQKWSKNGQKMVKMVENGRKWSKIIKNDQKLNL